VTPSAKREAVGLMTTEHGLSVARACRAVRLSRATYYRPTVPRALTRIRRSTLRYHVPGKVVQDGLPARTNNDQARQ